jgi:uncharacterized protein (DUF2345 family)
MDRSTVYTQEQGRSVDFLFAQRAAMIGLAKLSQAAFGASTVVRGLPVTPNSPAALNVIVGIGEIYAMTAVDATSWGALGADTTDIILKQGLNMTAQTISTPAPGTPGYSINYLIQAQYQDQDTNPVVMPFYNSNNPQQPLNGQGGNGAPLPTQRQGVCVIQAKAGVAATTGTQVAPTVDSGWTALAVVTVANGQTTVTSGNISIPAGVPQITSLVHMMQTGSATGALDTSATTNQITVALTPPIQSYQDRQEITFTVANSNTGPCTINAGGGSVNLVGVAGALQGGELIAGKQYTALYSASLNEFVLNSQTGGAQQINPATASEHAVQLAQLLAVNGPQAILSYTNSTTITLSRYRTGYVYSPGYGVVQIPSGGLTATASGLTPSTLYYVYLNPNAGSPTLVTSTTTHQTDSTGVEVMSGDNTKVLVGMAYAITATSWLSVVRSWVHDRGISLTAVLSASSSTNSTTPVNINTGLQISFLAWANELAQFSVNSSCSISTANTNIETYIALDNSPISGAVASETPSTTNVISQTVAINSQSINEGLNTVNMFGQVGSSSATGMWYANQTSTNVTIAPRA